MNGESLRQNRFRYTRWFDEQGQTTDEMLFDLASDPYEQANLAGLAEHAALKSRLRAYLDEHRSGPVWSEGLGEQLDRWRLASSIFGGMVLVALAYPIPVIVGLVIVLVATVFLLLRRRRMWCSEQRSAAQA
jgi:Flp pilus assembly protein TadB